MPRQASDDAPWLTAIADFRRCGLTQAEFCRRRELPLLTFRSYLDGRRAIDTAPYLAIDNITVENALRSITVGRRNWPHLGSDAGGRTATVPMSLVPSCRRLGNEPFAYLRDVLDRVSAQLTSRVDDSLPDRRVLPGPSDRPRLLTPA